MQHEFDPLNYPLLWYFGQPRVPATYLDKRDYVFGSQDKLVDFLGFIKANASFDFLSVVNNPGAALIGDDLARLLDGELGEVPHVVIESPGFSENVCVGYENAVIRLVETIKPPRGPIRPKSVNLLGVSVFHKNYKGDVAELSRLFDMCGVTVNCALCAGSSIDEIRSLGAAALNVVVNPEFGARTAALLKNALGTPYYVCDGPPVGFEATEALIGHVCDALECDRSRFDEADEEARIRAYVNISRVNSLTGLPKGVPIAIQGNYSEVYAYCKFLVEYFGLVVDRVSLLCEKTDGYKKRLEELLGDYLMSGALSGDITDSDCDLVFGNANAIARMKLAGKVFSGIEISLPSMGYLDVIDKTHLGLSGALLLTELVLNGLLF
jgi:nitrogenase molybdenum-iron protein alpha/beta subunit